jgi:hypothetical protein
VRSRANVARTSFCLARTRSVSTLERLCQTRSWSDLSLVERRCRVLTASLFCANRRPRRSRRRHQTGSARFVLHSLNWFSTLLLSLFGASADLIVRWMKSFPSAPTSTSAVQKAREDALYTRSVQRTPRSGPIIADSTLRRLIRINISRLLSHRTVDLSCPASRRRMPSTLCSSAQAPAQGTQRRC